MAIDRTRTLRGALAGAAAAAVWAAQQPLDKRVFGTEYDDCELLGTLVTRRRAAYPLGVGMHIGYGAVFGALYATAAPSLPGPRSAQAPLAAMLEHLAAWPLTNVTDRLHPARSRMPVLWGNGRAFAQATWRHLLFGVVLGEVERRLNPPADSTGPVDRETAATNGHGSIERLVAGPVS
jgi:hypothetical protein